MEEIFIDIMEYVSIYSVLLPLGVGLLFYKYLDFNSRLVVWLLIFASISQLWGHMPISDNLIWPMYNFYSTVELVIWGYLFYKNSKNQNIRFAIVGIVILKTVAAFLHFGLYGITSKFFTEFVCLNSLLSIVWVLSFFYERYKREEILALEKEPIFWFCLGLLIYSPTTYFIFVYYGAIRDSAITISKQIWAIHHVMNASMYFIFLFGICLNFKSITKLINVFRVPKS